VSYAATHARTYRTVARKGAAVSFEKPSTAATFDSATDTAASPESVTTIPGVAIQDKGKPSTYARLSLVQSQAPTLLFVPAAYGSLPEPGATCTWAGAEYAVADVDPIAPNGVPIAAMIVVSRG
jgi:hypothetical protein